MPIELYSNETQTQWDHGDFQVKIMSATSDKPIGFCNGTAADEEEITETGSLEGVEIRIDKKRLKTGREVWTVVPISEL